MRVLISAYLIMIISLSSCASTQTKDKISPQEDQLQSVSTQQFIIPAILMDGKKVGDLVLGQTTLNQALKIMPPWPGYPPGPLPIEQFEKANPGLLERLEKAGEVLKRVKKSYNPMNAMYILFFDKNEKLVIVQRDYMNKEEMEEVGKIYDQYQHQMKEVFKDAEVVRMQGEIQPCITLEVFLDTKKLKNGEPFRTGHIFTCSMKQSRAESKDTEYGCAHTTEVDKIDANSIIGVWTDKEQKYIYAFLENSKFKFWVFRDHPEKTQGVWKMNDQFWTESLRTKKEKIEKLYIYTNTIRCFMSARFNRNKLMLRKEWMEEIAFTPDLLDVCSDKVLTKTEKMPQE